MKDFGDKLDQLSSAPYYCVKTLAPLGIALVWVTYNAIASGFLEFNLFSKILITSCAVIAFTILAIGLADAYSNRLSIHQRGLVLHSDGFARYIEYNRIGKFVWKTHTNKNAFFTKRVHTCSIIEKNTGNCIAQLSSTKYSNLGNKLTKLEHKLDI